jgi:hypothetical protein
VLGTVILAALVLACGVLALAFALRAANRSRHGRPIACTAHALVAALWLALAAAVALVGVDVGTYARLTYEAHVAEVRFRQMGDRRFDAELILPDGARQEFVLAGDEWQLDARVLKWHGAATLLGLDTGYRLDRIGGRYRDIERERSAPRTVFELAHPPGVDVWRLARRFHAWLPWLDALYGSATYLPMAEGAHYAVTISPTGLVARPLNREAREAVAAWH